MAYISEIKTYLNLHSMQIDSFVLIVIENKNDHMELVYLHHLLHGRVTAFRYEVCLTLLYPDGSHSFLDGNAPSMAHKDSLNGLMSMTVTQVICY